MPESILKKAKQNLRWKVVTDLKMIRQSKTECSEHF